MHISSNIKAGEFLAPGEAEKEETLRINGGQEVIVFFFLNQTLLYYL